MHRIDLLLSPGTGTLANVVAESMVQQVVGMGPDPAVLRPSRPIRRALRRSSRSKKASYASLIVTAVSAVRIRLEALAATGRPARQTSQHALSSLPLLVDTVTDEIRLLVTALSPL